mgnify:CR=1 FL=1
MGFEVIQVTDTTVACDGDNHSNHPRVYLDLTKSSEVICPYCSRTFIHSES